MRQRPELLIDYFNDSWPDQVCLALLYIRGSVGKDEESELLKDLLFQTWSIKVSVSDWQFSWSLICLAPFKIRASTATPIKPSRPFRLFLNCNTSVARLSLNKAMGVPILQYFPHTSKWGRGVAGYGNGLEAWNFIYLYWRASQSARGGRSVLSLLACLVVVSSENGPTLCCYIPPKLAQTCDPWCLEILTPINGSNQCHLMF